MRALVLSGGGSKGAFQVGALEHMLGELELQYDIFTGISVGALNTSFLSQFKTGEEKESIKGLVDVWNTVNDRRIFKLNHRRMPRRLFKRETFSMIRSALGKLSFYDSTPLEELVAEVLDPERASTSGKRLAVGGVSLTDGEIRFWREDSPDIVKAVAASAAYPVFFRPVEIEGTLWTDGGIRHTTPIEKAISMGATEIDVILTGPRSANHTWNVDNTVQHLLAVIGILLDEVWDTDMIIGALIAEQEDIPVRLLFPTQGLGTDGLDFSPDSIKLNRELGYQEAKSIEWT